MLRRKNSQITIDGESSHRIQFMSALKHALNREHISKSKYDELRRSYDNYVR